MRKQSFVLNKKKLIMMTASTVIVLSLATPVILADEPGFDTPIDDSLEELQPIAPTEPGIDVPIDDSLEEPPTKPVPPVAPVVEPAVEDATKGFVTDPSQNPTLKVRVIVLHVDEKGKEIFKPQELRGDVGMSYMAMNLNIDDYEITSTTGAPTKGVFTNNVVKVTYTYMFLGSTIPTTPTEPPTTEPGDDTIIDDSGEEIVTPPTTDGGDTPVTNEDDVDAILPVDEEVIDDSREELSDAEKTDKNAPAIGAVDKTDKGNKATERDGMKTIPQASAETNWGMLGAGFAAIAAAFITLLSRRKKSDVLSETGK